MIHIVTDSTAQLTEQEIQENQITIVPLEVSFEGQHYRDRVDISRAEFSHRLDTQADTVFPKTSQPSVGRFLEAYQAIIKPGDAIISIHIGSVLSGTAQAAQMAADQIQAPISVIDSGLTDRGLGFVVLKAAELVKTGLGIDDITTQLKAYLPQISLNCFVNSLDYLVKGGRANRAVGFISSLVKLKLQLVMADGKLEVAHKARGEKGMRKLLKQVVDQIIANPKVSRVGLSYVDSHADTDAIEATLKQARPDLEIVNELTSPTIMTHVGPRGLAIIYV